MQKNNYRLNFFYQLYSNRFMIFVSMIEFIVLSCLCVNIAQSGNWFENFIEILNSPSIIGLGVLPLLFFNSGRISLMFEELNALSIRFENKKNYIKELIINIVINNTFIYVIFLMFATIFLNFFRGGNFSIMTIEKYNITNMLYFIFVIFKVYIFINIVVVITTLIFKLTKIVYSTILQLIIIASMFFLCPYPKNVFSIKEVSLNPLHIVRDTLIFKNFIFYILYVVMFIFIGILLIYFLYKKCISKDIKVIV